MQNVEILLKLVSLWRGQMQIVAHRLITKNKIRLGKK